MQKVIKTIVIILIISYPILTFNAVDSNEGSELPSYFSWNDLDGIDYTTPIKDQSPAPTCEAYALVASLETIMQYKLGEMYNPDLSEAHLYFYKFTGNSFLYYVVYF